ncbi:MAG: hypothetical protein AW09_004031 [Candidatus Accumulibacter phosphatis]|uniref:Uncharacterized protein n=1 Tax=Candidatus Accumulibacter phosphatis TaxID=327160 RepID=A0A080LRK1_9PROT|nr:MAG: hypothetical protein AW09_004031 [Candidatus Accumulibacter phosphatis]
MFVVGYPQGQGCHDESSFKKVTGSTIRRSGNFNSRERPVAVAEGLAVDMVPPRSVKGLASILRFLGVWRVARELRHLLPGPSLTERRWRQAAGQQSLRARRPLWHHPTCARPETARRIASLH